MSKEIQVELLTERTSKLGKKGANVSVSPELAKSLERHTLAKRVVGEPKTPGKPAEKRQTRTTSPKSNRAKG
jgi:hypothetical protein